MQKDRLDQSRPKRFYIAIAIAIASLINFGKDLASLDLYKQKHIHILHDHPPPS